MNRHTIRRAVQLATFLTLLTTAAITGTLTTVHNGITLIALALLLTALAYGLRIAKHDDHTRITADTTALAEVSR